MISFRPYNVILPKFIIEEKIIGGVAALIAQMRDGDIQEDEYLVAIGLQNATEVRNAMETLEGLGIDFNDDTSRSDDFTVLAKEGIWWPVPWLVNKEGNSWFIADVEVPM